MINIKINLGVLLLLGATYASSDHALRGLVSSYLVAL